MPHQCTNCGRRFPDGSKEMLSGCPDCGGNKFQFQPGGRSDGADAGADAEPQPPDSGAPPDTDGDPLSRSWPSHDPEEDPDDADIIEPDPEPRPAVGGEDGAQADARAEVAAPDELADPAHADDPAGARTDDSPGVGAASGESDAAEPPPASGEVASTPDGDGPALTELREELNDQFESIRVLNPGQYELNLMELYDREEYIISLREDGRYVIEVPETWRDSDPE